MIFIYLVSITTMIYFLVFRKRTKKGNEEYTKWNALKNFLNDFGRMNEKEIMEITLWERYLVYATVFKIADKVEKVMKVKLQDFNYNDTDFTFFSCISFSTSAFGSPLKLFLT